MVVAAAAAATAVLIVVTVAAGVVSVAHAFGVLWRWPLQDSASMASSYRVD